MAGARVGGQDGGSERVAQCRRRRWPQGHRKGQVWPAVGGVLCRGPPPPTIGATITHSTELDFYQSLCVAQVAQIPSRVELETRRAVGNMGRLSSSGRTHRPSLSMSLKACAFGFSCNRPLVVPPDRCSNLAWHGVEPAVAERVI